MRRRRIASRVLCDLEQEPDLARALLKYREDSGNISEAEAIRRLVRLALEDPAE